MFVRSWSNPELIWRIGIAAMTVMCCVPFSGCQNSSDEVRFAPVNGKILYKGQPISTGKLVMIHSSGKAGACEIGPDGTYRLEAPVGENRVMIDDRDQQKLAQMSPAQAQRMPSALPERFRDYMSSGLKLTVVEGNNQHDFNLKN